MDTLSVDRLTSARIPTAEGEFTLTLYGNSADDKDHLALVCGDLDDADEVLVRIHSECFTGDVLGSLRCDCGEQLQTSMRQIAAEGTGVLLYLRQEGRGIGLESKLEAYNLQDQGYDTVEANRLLGHGADERDYSIGARILEDLGARAVRLLTNNPEKIESLENHGISVVERVPLEPHLNRHNTEYLRTKVERMRHLLDLGPMNRGPGDVRSTDESDVAPLERRIRAHQQQHPDRPFVTLTFAQSLDGSIATTDRDPLSISGPESMAFTHRLRAAHDAILVGIGTVLSDNPRLTVRRCEGGNPIPVVLDTQLRFPPDARLLSGDGPAPIIATNESAPDERKRRLEQKGGTVVRLSCDDSGICLAPLLDELGTRGLHSIMVEGGSEVITSFLRHRLVDRIILTVAPTFVGGHRAVQSASPGDEDVPKAPYPRLENIQYRWLGEDLVLEGTPDWPD